MLGMYIYATRTRRLGHGTYLEGINRKELDGLRCGVAVRWVTKRTYFR